MFITLFTYRAKAGQEEKIVALHEEWRRDRLARAKGFLSGELVHSIKDRGLFTTIARFESEVASQAVAGDPDQDAWYRRLVRLTEAEPVFSDWVSDWRIEPGEIVVGAAARHGGMHPL